MELITQDQETSIIALDDTAKQTQLAVQRADESGSPTLKAIVLAKGMQRIRSMLTDEMLSDIMDLQGSPLGFRTDKDNEGGYSVKVIRDVTLEATLRGFRMVGNEVNIIAGRFYPTKEGFDRVLREWPGLRDLSIEMEIPELFQEQYDGIAKDGKPYKEILNFARVSAIATFTINGRPMSLVFRKIDDRDRRIVVKLNKGMGHDGALGKAKARICRRIVEKLTGLRIDQEPEAEADTVDAESKTVEVDALDHWGEHSQEIAEQLEQCTDREQLEKIYRTWLAYATTAARKSQLSNACAFKASKLKETK